MVGFRRRGFWPKFEKFGMKERHYVLVTGLAGPKLRTYPGEVKDGRFVYSAPLLAGKVLQPVKDTKGKELSECRGGEKTSRQEEQTTRDYGIYYKTGAKKAERNAPVDAEEKAEWRG